MPLATAFPSDPNHVISTDSQQADLSATFTHQARIATMRRLSLLGTPAEQAFDRLTRLATKIFRAPVALLSMVDGNRTFFKSSVGLPEPWASRREMPLSHSVCQHVIAKNAPLIINDARANPLVTDNQAVAELLIVAYMGIPLVTSEKQVLGTFAVIDTVPREWTSDDVTTLGDLAASALTEIELRAETSQRHWLEQRLDLLESIVGSATVAVLIAEAELDEDSEPRVVFVNDAYTRLTGLTLDDVIGEPQQFLNSTNTDRTQVDTVYSALKARKPACMELQSHRKDGTTFSAELSIVPIADKSGRYSHWVVIQRDISEQKAAESALRCGEERFRSFVLASSQIVWTTDPAGKLIVGDSSVWSTWLAFTGQTAEQARGDGWLAALHPDDRAPTAAAWAEAVFKKSPFRKEYRLRSAAGAYRHMVSQGVPVFDAEGQVREWVGTNLDITERKLAEEGLRRNEAELHRLALIVQRTNNAVILTDPQGRIEWINEGCIRICEYQLEEVMGKTPGSIFQGPATDPATVKHMHEQLVQGRGFNVQILNYAKSGRMYWLAIEVQPIRDDQGKLTGFMAIESDITEQKRSEELLKEANQELESRVAERTVELSTANEFLKAVLDNIQDGIVACNADGELNLFNRTIRENYGLAEMPTRPEQWANGFDFYHVDGQTRMTVDELPLIRALRGERIQNLEMQAASKETGVMRTCMINGQAVFDGQGNKLGAVVSVSDITEQKRAQAQLRTIHDELERRVEARTAELAVAKEIAEAASKAKNDFFSRMSHELRTPLNVILGFGQLLELDDLSKPQRESAEQIVKGGRHLLALINEILDIARIEAVGGGELLLEEVDANEIIAEVLAMVRPLVSNAGLHLTPPLPPTRSWVVRADPQRFKQIMLNLLSNAIKYNRPGGSITVNCECTSSTKLRIGVTDTGSGIPAEKLPRLFAPFERLEAASDGIAGTGLGLTLTKTLVEVMHGTMGVDSTVGVGSTFWIELPRIDSVYGLSSENPATAAKIEDTAGTAGTVLYIEDNPGNFRLIERLLKLRPGVHLLSAVRGRLGINLAREHHPDLIFLDLHLPDINGDEVLRELRKDEATRHIPIIILSADATLNQIERLLAEGANRYLVKPVDVKEFLEILDEKLGKQESTK